MITLTLIVILILILMTATTPWIGSPRRQKERGRGSSARKRRAPEVVQSTPEKQTEADLTQRGVQHDDGHTECLPAARIQGLRPATYRMCYDT